MTATVIPIHATRPAPSSEEYLGWQLTLYENKESRSGEPRSAASADDLIESYREPLWLSPDDPRAVSGEAIKSGSPATTAGIGGRKKDTVGPARVLFVDYDRSAADGCDGLLPDEFEAFLTALQSWGVAFALHTTTSTAWLPEGRRKLRAVFPLEEPVLGEGYRRLWDTVAQHMQAACKVSPDKGKHSPENLMFLPVFRTDHSDRWGFWRSAQGARLLWDLPIAEAGLAAAATGDPYARVRTARNKDEARARAAFHVGAAYVRDEVGAITAEALQAHVDKVVWPEMRAALEACVAGGHSDPVKDWLGAEERTLRNFAAGVADAAREQETKLAARKAELLNELRLAAGFAQLLTIGKANGRNCKASCDSLQRLGSLVAAAADLGMPTEEASTIRARVLRAIDTNTTAAKAKLSAAWTAGLAVPVVVAEEMRAAQARVSWQDLGLTLTGGEEDSRPKACVKNVRLLFNHPHSPLSGLFARNIRALNGSVTVRKTFDPWTEGDLVNLNSINTLAWFTDYARKRFKMQDVQHEEYTKALSFVKDELPTYDPVIDYLEQLPAERGCSTEVLETFFVRHAGVVDDELTRAATRALFMSAVKTVYEPGCRVPYMWILIGRKQGQGKSDFLEHLCFDPEHKGLIDSDELAGRGASDNGRKHKLTAARKWLVEIGEVDFSGASLKATKRFVTEYNADLRESYKEDERRYPRRSVFVGNANDEFLFKDLTGERRYPIMVMHKTMDMKAVAAERDSLWTEALRLYRTQPDAHLIPSHLWEAALDRAEDHHLPSELEAQVEGLSQADYVYPIDMQGLANLERQFQPVPNMQATGGEFHKVLSTAQLCTLLRTRDTGQLVKLLRKFGWRTTKSRGTFTNGKQVRVWLHPAWSTLLPE